MLTIPEQLAFRGELLDTDFHISAKPFSEEDALRRIQYHPSVYRPWHTQYILLEMLGIYWPRNTTDISRLFRSLVHKNSLTSGTACPYSLLALLKLFGKALYISMRYEVNVP